MKYIFKTKFARDYDRNGQECDFVKVLSKDKESEIFDLILIRFSDGKEIDCYRNELYSKN